MSNGLSLEKQVIAALRRILRAIDQHSKYLADRHGVTGPQLLTLQELARLGKTPVSALARTIHVSHPTMTGIVDRLERQGLVSRERDAVDRRRLSVSVTHRGREILSGAPSPLQDRFRVELAKLADWEQTQMLATLQRIAALMDAEAIDAAPVLTTGNVDTIPAPTVPGLDSPDPATVTDSATPRSTR